jgi:hypothetical protein
VRDANRRLNGNRAAVTVVVKSRFRKGSFVTTVALVQSLVEQAVTLLDPIHVYDVVALAKLLALTVYSEKPKEVVENLFELLKFLGGEEPASKETDKDGAIHTTNVRGDTTIVNHGTMVLYNDNSIRNDVRRLLTPLRQEGIDSFETRVPAGGSIETVTKEELPRILPPPAPAALATAEIAPDAIETRSTGFFQIVSLTFREGNKWKVNAGQGDFWAEMTDPLFLTKMHRREVGFFEGDTLRAEYVNVATRRGGKIETDTKLVNVLDIIPGEFLDEQTELLPPS